jgi:hypothetical protein
MGMKATDMKAKMLPAQAMLRCSYIWNVNSGKAPPSAYLRTPFAATARGEVSMGWDLEMMGFHSSLT